MNLSLNNYNKPSHPLFKRIGDICLFAIPLYTPIILSLPMTGTIKLMVTIIISTLLATVKIISKFSIDPNYKEQDDNKDAIHSNSDTESI
jgi:hypothetical protein